MSRFMPLDNGSFRAQYCQHVSKGLFLIGTLLATTEAEAGVGARSKL
jgi:hypothetical protein